MQNYFLFTCAFLISVATPGPDVVVVTSRALVGRATDSPPFIFGIVLGKLLFLAAALLGLAALADTIGPYFQIVKLMGAIYLAYLGVRLLRRSPHSLAETPSRPVSPGKDAVLGLFMSIGNPVAILFYVALLPSVVDVRSVTFATGVALGTIVTCCTFAVYGSYAVLAARAGKLFRSAAAQRRVHKSAGAAMIGAAMMAVAR